MSFLWFEEIHSLVGQSTWMHDSKPNVLITPESFLRRLSMLAHSHIYCERLRFSKHTSRTYYLEAMETREYKLQLLPNDEFT